MISRLFATYRNFDASRFLLEFTTDRFASLAIIYSFQTALPYRPAGDGGTPQGLAGTGVCRLFQRRPQGHPAHGHVRRHRLFYFGEHRHPRAEPDSGNVGLGSAARLVRQPDAWPVHHDHRRGTALRQKAKEAVLHRHLRTFYRFRNDARPVQPADPIRLQLAGRLFSHGIVCAVLCRPAYRPDKAAVPVILRKIFREPLNNSLCSVPTRCISRNLYLVKVISAQNIHYLSAFLLLFLKKGRLPPVSGYGEFSPGYGKRIQIGTSEHGVQTARTPVSLRIKVETTKIKIELHSSSQVV